MRLVLRCARAGRQGMISFVGGRRALGRLFDSGSAWFVLVGLLAAYFTLLLALGGHRAWDLLGVPWARTGFLDLRSLTSGWDCARDNLGVWPNNPCDPEGRPENYPRLWITASVLGLGQDDTYAIGFPMVVAFFVAAILVLPRQASVGTALVYGFALCSPSVMLGVERGNVDILLFAMIVTAGLVMRRTPWGPPVASGLILLAGMLKLFPIAATGMLTGLPRRAATVSISLVGGAFALYAALTFGDIQTINRVVPQDDEFQYGLRLSEDWLDRAFGHGLALEIALVVFTLALALLLSGRASLRATTPSRELDFFCAGAAVYVTTFVLLRGYDYRLVFLLLTVPQLVRWASAGRLLAIATLAGVLGALWLPPHWDRVPLLRDGFARWNELTLVGDQSLPIAWPAQAAAFVGLAVLLVASLRANWRRGRVDTADAGIASAVTTS